MARRRKGNDSLMVTQGIGPVEKYFASKRCWQKNRSEQRHTPEQTITERLSATFTACTLNRQCLPVKEDVDNSKCDEGLAGRLLLGATSSRWHQCEVSNQANDHGADKLTSGTDHETFSATLCDVCPSATFWPGRSFAINLRYRRSPTAPARYPRRRPCQG